MITEQMDRLDRALAEKLMGWELVEKIEDGDKIGEWFKDGKYTGFDAYFIDRKTGLWRDLGTLWSPTRRIDQALGDGGPRTVDYEMKEKGYGLFFGYYPMRGRYESYYTNDGIIYETGVDSTPSMSVSLAAAKALGIKIEENIK